MIPIRRGIVVLILSLSFATTALAHHRHHYVHPMVAGLAHGFIHMLESIGPRPSRWCGWEMRREMGVSDPTYNLARNWSHYGSPASGPAVGVIVVYSHHVGRIVSKCDMGWVVHSGNDGHAIRDRCRSVAKAIAFRWPT
jgi:hypothetical protein